METKGAKLFQKFVSTEEIRPFRGIRYPRKLLLISSAIVSNLIAIEQNCYHHWQRYNIVICMIRGI